MHLILLWLLYWCSYYKVSSVGENTCFSPNLSNMSNPYLRWSELWSLRAITDFQHEFCPTSLCEYVFFVERVDREVRSASTSSVVPEWRPVKSMMEFQTLWAISTALVQQVLVQQVVCSLCYGEMNWALKQWLDDGVLSRQCSGSNFQQVMLFQQNASPPTTESTEDDNCC